MGRRTQKRFVKETPDNFYFIPSKDNAIALTIAEFEAMRLKHYIKLNQKDASDKMGVSQPTFSRILENAHQKITQALIDGVDIRVFGGNVDFKKSFVGYGCLNCTEEWENVQASKDQREKINCPKCKSVEIYYLVKEPI